jgi:hypothetical protein
LEPASPDSRSPRPNDKNASGSAKLFITYVRPKSASSTAPVDDIYEDNEDYPGQNNNTPTAATNFYEDLYARTGIKLATIPNISVKPVPSRSRGTSGKRSRPSSGKSTKSNSTLGTVATSTNSSCNKAKLHPKLENSPYAEDYLAKHNNQDHDANQQQRNRPDFTTKFAPSEPVKVIAARERAALREQNHKEIHESQFSNKRDNRNQSHSEGNSRNHHRIPSAPVRLSPGDRVDGNLSQSNSPENHHHQRNQNNSHNHLMRYIS